MFKRNLKIFLFCSFVQLQSLHAFDHSHQMITSTLLEVIDELINFAKDPRSTNLESLSDGNATDKLCAFRAWYFSFYLNKITLDEKFLQNWKKRIEGPIDNSQDFDSLFPPQLAKEEKEFLKALFFSHLLYRNQKVERINGKIYYRTNYQKPTSTSLKLVKWSRSKLNEIIRQFVYKLASAYAKDPRYRETIRKEFLEDSMSAENPETQLKSFPAFFALDLMLTSSGEEKTPIILDVHQTPSEETKRFYCFTDRWPLSGTHYFKPVSEEEFFKKIPKGKAAIHIEATSSLKEPYNLYELLPDFFAARTHYNQLQKRAEMKKGGEEVALDKKIFDEKLQNLPNHDIRLDWLEETRVRRNKNPSPFEVMHMKAIIPSAPTELNERPNDTSYCDHLKHLTLRNFDGKMTTEEINRLRSCKNLESLVVYESGKYLDPHGPLRDLLLDESNPPAFKGKLKHLEFDTEVILPDNHYRSEEDTAKIIRLRRSQLFPPHSFLRNEQDAKILASLMEDNSLKNVHLYPNRHYEENDHLGNIKDKTVNLFNLGPNDYQTVLNKLQKLKASGSKIPSVAHLREIADVNLLNEEQRKSRTHFFKQLELLGITKIIEQVPLQKRIDLPHGVDQESESTPCERLSLPEIELPKLM